jgi:hypothetical protein
VRKCLTNALNEFVKAEHKLLEQDPREEAISSAMIPHLKRSFGFWTVNIDHKEDKRILQGAVVKKAASFLRTELPNGHIPNSQRNAETIEKESLPDLIFRDRMSSANNFMVIEIKKFTNKNKDDRNYDIAKLEKITTFDLAYNFGEFIEISTGFHLASKLPFLIRLIEKGTWV